MAKRFSLHRRLSLQLTCIVIAILLPCFLVFLSQAEVPLKGANITLLLAILVLLTFLLFFVFRHFLKPLDQENLAPDPAGEGSSSDEFVALEEKYNGLVQDLREKETVLHALTEEVKNDKQGNRQDQTVTMEAAKVMAAGLAHDFNNILTGIVSYPELLLMKLPEESPLRPPIENIREAGDRASKVVADLQAMAGSGSLVKEKTSMNTLIRHHLQSEEHQALCTQHPEITLETELDDTVEPIFCSRIHISTCLANLICHGFTTISGRGTVAVTTGKPSAEGSGKEEPDLDQANYITLTVTDSGEAISDKDIDRIFEPFYTKRVMEQQCSGLGLSVAWNIAQEHGGQITAHSSSTGNRFTVYLPVTNVPEEEGLTTPS
ncbi:MAG: ATP-binding protein [Thermodesulfobacteriota bacterium]